MIRGFQILNMHELRVAGLTLQKIGDRFGVTKQRVHQILSMPIVTDQRERKRFEKEELAKRAIGERPIQALKRIPSLPRIYKTRDGYIIEGLRHQHRLVAERVLGRRLRHGEAVHHINGDRSDNRPENLAIFPTIGAHLAYHNAKKPSYNHWQGKAIFLSDLI